MRVTEYISLNDNELITRLKTGDESAFTEIYARYSVQMMERAIQILTTDEMAADIVQDIFLTLWHRKESIEIDSLHNYLMQSVRFMALHAVKDGKVKQAAADGIARASATVLFSDPVLLQELEHLISVIFESLPEDQRTIFNMHREQSKTYPQIARELGISVKTVEKKISNTLKAFRGGTGDYICPTLLFFVLTEFF